MKNSIQEIKEKLFQEIQACIDEEILEKIKASALGKNGIIPEFLKRLAHMDPEERREQGPLIHNLKTSVTDFLNERRGILKEARIEKELLEQEVDITLPVVVSPSLKGRIHPISYVIEEITYIFKTMGFSVADGPEIETNYYNFTALNFPEDHPAREMHDTFFLKNDFSEEPKLLRTHTSSVQIRTMQQTQPPIRIIVPGKAYRLDSDATHTPMFHQLEGLVVDEQVNMRNMRWVLEEFCKRFFKREDLVMRFRPSFFPFTQPSIEVDIRCDRSSGKNIHMGTGNDWIEVLGCGMVHPQVLKNVGIDSEKYQGFAWGMGLDRMAMLKYNISDLRSFFDADVRWLSYYGFRPLSLFDLLKV